MASESEYEINTLILNAGPNEKTGTLQNSGTNDNDNDNDTNGKNGNKDDDATNKDSKPTKTESSNTRCNFESCNKRFGVIPYECKCGFKFCAKHRHDFEHNCTYDRKLDDSNKLKKILVKTKPEKIKKI